MRIHLRFPLIALTLVAVATWPVTSCASQHSLVGQWASADEELMFFARGEFTFQEHGPVGKWTLDGKHLTFGIPAHGTRRAEVVHLTRDRLVLQSSGKRHVYHRVEHD
jgi:hypothetical protein